MKRKGRTCVPIGRGEPQQLHYSGKVTLRTLYSELIHLHLPSQPAPGAGWVTHNTPQMSLSSRVHQLKLINIPPQAEVVPPAQRAAEQAMAEQNTSRSSNSQSPGQQVHLAGSREGHSMVLAPLAHRLRRQSWAVYKLIAEGIWLEKELSTLQSVLRETRVGFHAGWLGAIHLREKRTTPLLPPKRPYQVAEPSSMGRWTHLVKDPRIEGQKNLFLTKVISSRSHGFADPRAAQWG